MVSESENSASVDQPFLPNLLIYGDTDVQLQLLISSILPQACKFQLVSLTHMASSSETSSGSSTLQNSGSEEDLQVLMDQRKRKRMVANSESARQSRMRKQEHLDDLVETVARLRNENNQILTSINFTTQKHLEVEAENSVLRAQMSELSSLLSNKRTYEVFMSFRGEDTRDSFVSHLYASLQNAGIIVFKDDESLPRGHYISHSLLRAIEQSQISLVVFSRNYAESRWCLQELEKIMELCFN
ncbi:bZIP transcription factor 44, partial [Mucuna pruriens]